MRPAAIKWIKRSAVVLGVLLAILIALPFFITLDDYIPRIEKMAAEKLHEPVTIKSIRFAGLPTPHLTIEGITVGKDTDLKLGKVIVTPDLFSLLGATKVIRSIDVDSMVVSRRALDLLTVLSKPAAPTQPAAVRVRNIKLDDASVQLEQGAFGPFDARVKLDESGEPEEATIVMRDGKLKLAIKPDQAKYLIEANAKSWKPPLGPAIVFDELVVKGVATLNDATFNEVNAKLYGGGVSGSAAVSWQRGLQVKGNFDVHEVELKQLAPLFSSNTHVSGRLNAKPVLSASSANADQLMNALVLNTAFNIENGVVYGVDIQKAALSLIKQGGGGGETHFDQLSGHLNLDHNALHFTQLKIVSGVLGAQGNLNISPKKELSGRIEAQVKAIGTSANVPLNVAGTISSPLLYPTGASITGAAVGSILLGPGLGTTVGAELGNMAQGLFGKKGDKKPGK